MVTELLTIEVTEHRLLALQESVALASGIPRDLAQRVYPVNVGDRTHNAGSSSEADVSHMPPFPIVTGKRGRPPASLSNTPAPACYTAGTPVNDRCFRAENRPIGGRATLGLFIKS